MDIFCRYCGEPWDHDTLHEFGDYKKRAKLFAQLGCNALMNEGELSHACDLEPVNSDVALASATLQDDSPFPDDWLGAEDLVYMMQELSQ